MANLTEARDRILQLLGVKGVAQSAVYETEPVEVDPAYKDLKFLNAVLIVESDKPAREWLRLCRATESDMGRRRTADRNAPRPVDIDLLYVGDTIMQEPELVLPHPRWAEREFVVKPLADVRPDLKLPGSTQTVREALAAVAGTGGLSVFAEDW